MRRGIAIMAVVLALIPAAFAAFLLWVSRTESGAAWLVQAAVSRSGSQFDVDAVAGTLRDRLRLTGVEATIGADRASLERLELEIDWSQLWSRRIVIPDLHVSQLVYRRAEAAPEPTEAPSAVQIDLEIGNALVERAVWIQGDDEYEIGPVSFALSTDGDHIGISRFDGSGLGISTQGNAAYRLSTGEIENAEFDWLYDSDPQDFEGVGRVSGTPSSLDIDITTSSPLEASVEGRLELDDAPRAEVRVRWSDLAWPEFPDAMSPRGDLELAGWIESFDYSGSGAIVVQEQYADFEIEGNGTPAQLFFDSLELVTEGGRVAASGELRLDPVSWAFAIDGEQIDPSQWFEEWAGSLSVRGDLTGRIDQALEWQLADARVDGRLRDREFSVAGTIGRTADSVWRLRGVELRSDDGVARLDGDAGNTLDLVVDIRAPDVSAFWPGAAGSLTVDGTVAGTRTAPTMSGEISGQNLEYEDFSARSLHVAGSASLSAAVPVALDVDVRDLRWREQLAPAVSGRIDGTAAVHTVAIDAEADFGDLALDAAGGWRNERWSGSLRAAEMTHRDFGAWTLEQPAALGFGRDRANLERACLLQGETRACAAVRFGATELGIDGQIERFDLATLNSRLPGDVTLSGLYDATIELTGAWPDARGSFSVAGDGTLITIRETASESLEIPIQRVQVDAVLDRGDLAADGAVLGEDSAEFRFSANILQLLSESPSLDISVSGLWPDVSALSLLSPDVGTVSGRAELDMRVAGTLRAPTVQGRAQWLDGMLSVPRWGFTIENATVTATSEDGETAVVEGTATAGEGLLNLSGVVALDPENGWPGSLRVTGDTIQAVRLPNSEILITPDLDVALALPDIRVSGSIDIPYARLQLDEVADQATLPSPDTVVHTGAVEEPTRPLRVIAELMVTLGDDVRYAGGGLEAALGGTLDVSYESGAIADANGAIDLAGQYQAYGQTLNIERSRLFFAGPFDNPEVDVRAVRVVDSQIAGVQLLGPLRSPTTRVFSEPALPEADALSYLIFGRPLSTTGAAEIPTLQSAALSMGLQQALPVVQRIGDSLGFDEFTVQTTTADAGELMAGKQLSPRLYMRYTYGLFNRLGGLLMRFELNDRFSLETRSGEYKSMDLIYSSEPN